MTDIDTVAEAICAADPDMQGALWPGKSEQGKDKYRRMAQAAIDALGLTEEWASGFDAGDGLQVRHPHPTADSRADVEKRLRLFDDEFLVSHWATGWVRVEEQPK